MSLRARKFLDFGLLQIGWFACVLSAAAGHVWTGPLAVLALIAIHLTYTANRAGELRLALAVAAVGATMDNLLASLGVTHFATDGPRIGWLPLWIVALWPMFATTLDSTLAWLQRRPALAALLGAIGGPPGYFAADRLGALELGAPGWRSFALLALAWAVTTPLVLQLVAWTRAPRPSGSEATAATR